MRQRYRRRPERHVTAVQLDLDFASLRYRKWGNEQSAKPGDWLVNNDGDVYTVAKSYFSDRYRRLGPGVFEKLGEVWAEQATETGSITTAEGRTDYVEGDYLVFDRQGGGPGYAVGKVKFEHLYEAVDDAFELTPAQSEYVERLERQIDWYDSHATVNRVGFLSAQTLAIVLAALVPVVSVFGPSGGSAFVTYLVAVLGGASAVTAGLLSLFNWQQNWVNYRRTCEDLKSHLAQFRAGAGVYADRRNAFELLVDISERILAAERGQWAERQSGYGVEAAAEAG